MPKPSNASDGSFDRAAIARDLYLDRGATAAALRCDINTRNGVVDFARCLEEALELRPGDRICDVCCGSGEQLSRFSEAVTPGGQAFGVDYSVDAVARARDRGLDVVCADASDAAALRGDLDALNCAFGVYYLPDPGRAVAAWRTALRPGGRLVISGPAVDTNAELYAFHKAVTGLAPGDADRMALGYVATTVRALVSGAGFGDITIRRIVNPIRFAQREFVEYWQATSLFARTGRSRDSADVALLEGLAPAEVTKVTDILIARRATE
jgi:SAM-dependent methyltransferase